MSVAEFDRPIIARPPRELIDFATRQVVNAKLHVSVERRSETRDLMVLPVLLQPIDADGRAAGSPIDVVTRDLSPHGCCLVHIDPISRQSVVLHLCIAETEVSLVARVLWCRPLGPFYGAGVKFIGPLQGTVKSQ